MKERQKWSDVYDVIYGYMEASGLSFNDEVIKTLYNSIKEEIQDKVNRTWKSQVFLENIKNTKLKKQFSFSEVGILLYLLSEHISSGDYFKNREQHYKMCKELFKKLNNIY